MKKIRLDICLWITCTACFLTGCSSVVPTPTKTQQDYAESRWASKHIDLEKGRSLYLEKCTSCHSAFAPTKFSEEKWENEMREMKIKAKLGDDEEFMIMAYILSENATRSR